MAILSVLKDVETRYFAKFTTAAGGFIRDSPQTKNRGAFVEKWN